MKGPGGPAGNPPDEQHPAKESNFVNATDQRHGTAKDRATLSTPTSLLTKTLLFSTRVQTT